MLYLYLDESGDLGFDFVNKRPSKYFVVTILTVGGVETNRSILRGVKKTIRRKLNPKGKRKRIVHELKATSTTLSVKEYFYNQIAHEQFGIYSMALNKRRVYEQLVQAKNRTYNFIARHVLDRIPFEETDCSHIELIVDRSKTKPEVENFNQYIRNQLEARIEPSTPLSIYHWDSAHNGGIQACDLFSWGIFQKYERKRTAWYDCFKDKIKFEDVYLP